MVVPVISRKQYIQRRKPLPKKRAKKRRSGRVRDEGYLAKVRKLEYCAAACDLPAPGPCSGIVEPDHQGERPVGRKANDDTAVPMCTGHHRQRTDYAGAFKGWSDVVMRHWCDRMIAETRDSVLAVARGEAGEGAFSW